MEHTVTFRLRHAEGSQAEADFLAAAAELASIPGVRKFRVRRQVSPKNLHTFGISMIFDTDVEYQAYRDHPVHEEFLEKYWIPEVAEFQEADFEELP